MRSCRRISIPTTAPDASAAYGCRATSPPGRSSSSGSRAVKDLGVVALGPRSVVSTDHVSFDAAGIPAFQFMVERLEYNSRTHHSNMDVYDRVQADEWCSRPPLPPCSPISRRCETSDCRASRCRCRKGFSRLHFSSAGSAQWLAARWLADSRGSWSSWTRRTACPNREPSLS